MNTQLFFNPANAAQQDCLPDAATLLIVDCPELFLREKAAEEPADIVSRVMSFGAPTPIIFPSM